MANIIGRHYKKWTEEEIKKLYDLRDENPAKIAFMLNKTIGSVNQERFRRGLTDKRPRLKKEEIEAILILRKHGFSVNKISVAIKRPYHSVYSALYRKGAV